MPSYGRTSANAIAIASLLAERWEGGRRTTSKEAAAGRGISKPLAARILVMMAQAGFVEGTPGPNGGYALSREPGAILLSEIVSVFQRLDPQDRCPYGPGWCGTGNPCPLHDELIRQEESHQEFLRKTSLSVFVGRSPERTSKPPAPKPGPKRPGRPSKPRSP
jgi:Rrf2 family protein